MSVQIQFNHHYQAGGIDYRPGDVATFSELDAQPLLYSAKARLLGQDAPSTELPSDVETAAGAQRKADDAAADALAMSIAYMRDYLHSND